MRRVPICRSSVTICSGVGLFFGMITLLSKPISIKSLGTKRATQVNAAMHRWQGE
jgi:hypothetical protein